MSNFNWCHGPRCHKQHTQDRVRGVKGSKVLRTKKIKVIEPLPRYYHGWENHFCKLACLMDFIKKHLTSMIALGPRTEALETPILDPKRTTNTYTYGMNNQYSYNRTETKIEVDETRSTSVG